MRGLRSNGFRVSPRFATIPEPQVEPLDPDAADTYETLLGEAGVAEMLHDEIATSDMVSEHWFGVMASQSDRRMALTELRATTMLLDFSGLLELSIPTGPVQHLAHPRRELTGVSQCPVRSCCPKETFGPFPAT